MNVAQQQVVSGRGMTRVEWEIGGPGQPGPEVGDDEVRAPVEAESDDRAVLHTCPLERVAATAARSTSSP